MDIRVRPVIGGLVSFVPGAYDLWDRMRPMGDYRPPEYGRDILVQRLADARAAGADPVLGTVVELGPGRSLSGPIGALLEGAERAVGLDAAAYATVEENLRVVDALTAEAGVGAARAEALRDAVRNATTAGPESALWYRAPWNDADVMPPGSVDFIWSISALEHVTNPSAIYRACFQWLRPGGIMVHKIDFSSHQFTKKWNGHYWVPNWIWRIAIGREDRYSINRLPPSGHREIAGAAGFDILAENPTHAGDPEDPFYAAPPVPQFRGLDRSELFVRTCTFIMRKPATPG
ncbi:MAG: methyltransferase domain-containing protein [Rhodospirillales bacterium]